MNPAIYLVYINGQPTRPLVHSIEEAKSHAIRHIAYKPSLKIQCYSMPHLISEWVYDYQADIWVEQVVNSDLKLYQVMK